MSDVNVVDLWSYPLKSCAGVQLDKAVVDATGFVLDREFMLIDEAGTFLTQRRLPALAKIQVSVEDDHLGISIPGFGTAEIDSSYNADLPIVETEVHGKAVVGLDQGNIATDIFCRFLSRDVRLLRASHEHPRYVSEPYRLQNTTNQVAFGDGFPFLLTSRASLRALHYLQDLKDEKVPMNRFRPNIVVEGAELDAFAEDTWKQVQVGGLGAFIVRACDRCKIPSIIQTGEDAGQDGEIAVKANFLKSRAGWDLADPSRPKGRFLARILICWHHPLDGLYVLEIA